MVHTLWHGHHANITSTVFADGEKQRQNHTGVTQCHSARPWRWRSRKTPLVCYDQVQERWSKFILTGIKSEWGDFLVRGSSVPFPSGQAHWAGIVRHNMTPLHFQASYYLAAKFLSSLSSTRFAYLAARSGTWMSRESRGGVSEWQIPPELQGTLSLRADSWHCLGLAWCLQGCAEHPQDVTLWLLCSGLKKVGVYTSYSSRRTSWLMVDEEKNVALKEIMMQPDCHKALAECVINSIVGHCHCHCQNLWDFCRDTENAPAVRCSSSPEKVHNRFLIALIKPLGKVCPSP